MGRPAKMLSVSALVIVSVVSAFTMVMAYRMNDVLSGPGWCAKAIGADQAAKDSNINVAASCVDLLTIQLKSVSTNSHILFGMFALCLLVLIVIVISGGELSFAASKAGVSGNIGAHAAAVEAAGATAGAAKDKAEEIAQGGGGIGTGGEDG